MDELKLAHKLFEYARVEAELEEALMDAEVTFDRLGWDWYDCSLEIYGVPPDERLSEAAQKVVYDAGFRVAYVNHTDKWETHYGFKSEEPFAVSNGWRVSYPHKRGDGGKIMVEEVVKSWPDDWFTSGSVVVIDKTQV